VVLAAAIRWLTPPRHWKSGLAVHEGRESQHSCLVQLYTAHSAQSWPTRSSIGGACPSQSPGKCAGLPQNPDFSDNDADADDETDDDADDDGDDDLEDDSDVLGSPE
jgi:hypothetical protein